MRRGGFGKESSDQPGTKDVPVTPVLKVLHPFTRVVVGLGGAAGGIWSLFTWDWRYFAAGCFVVAGGLVIGPWVWPHEKVRLEVDAPKPVSRDDLLPGDEGDVPWGKS